MNPEENRTGGLSLDELNLTPDWVKAPVKSFDKHPGERPDRRSDSRDHGDRPPRPRRDDRRGPANARGGPRRDRRDQPPRPVSGPPPAPLNLEITFLANEQAFAGMVEMMKQTPRAYALFDIAKLVLNKPERHLVKFTRKDGTLYRPLLIEGVCLAQDEALRHLFRHCPEKIFTQAEKAIDPPKGNFQFVNRCGFTGVILGPPNFHEYQSRLIKHHQQRLAHVPFDQFKSRIETTRDPEIVKAWVESRSKTIEYTCLLDPEPKIFTDRSELEKHIREHHLPALVAAANEVQVSGPASRQIENHRLLEALRRTWEEERKFPLRTVNVLRPHLVKEGFHFFKHKKGITYITRIKLNRFESIAHLTEHVQKIILFLRANPDATRKQLAAHLAPVDETLLAADLHWLIQDGYVVEFYDGKLWALDEKQPPKPAASSVSESPVQPPTAGPVVVVDPPPAA
ncbi:MAG: hypothetical protein PCFJNLEI_01896 [Verrucomicrobiae bacterium]|nr:hypothetical protein [Verrucomicrobiae bacterium]